MADIMPSLRLSANPEWSTPDDVFSALDSEFGFSLDCCANEANRKCPRWCGPGGICEDGLSADWRGERVWMNPPYGREIGQWVAKAAESARTPGTLVVGLLPNRTDTRWWQSVMEATEVRFVKGRLKFGGCDQGAPFGSVIVVWGAPRVPVISSVTFKGASE